MEYITLEGGKFHVLVSQSETWSFLRRNDATLVARIKVGQDSGIVCDLTSWSLPTWDTVNSSASSSYIFNFEKLPATLKAHLIKIIPLADYRFTIKFIP